VWACGYNALNRAAGAAGVGIMPRDRFGRTIDYLRISLIDHCNLRCVYCMPLRGLRFIPSNELLTAEELSLAARAAANLGFRKIRLTGGEPTLRADLVNIVAGIRRSSRIPDLGMTTNGVLLPGLAVPLRDAGLHRLNIHVDTLHPDRLKRVMRFGNLNDILAGIDAAQRAGFSPIKINAVVVRDYNHEDVVDLALLTLDRPWHVRFIELMPLGTDDCARLSLSQYVPNPETAARLEREFGPLEPLPPHDASDECRNYRLPGAEGVIGFISPVSDPYCGTCNRMRLTADGKLHLCLLHDEEIDLRPALRDGGVTAVEEVLLRAITAKPTGHQLDQGISTRNRNMFQLGG
jgi:cyclic pyranopterin phosphate synthase